MAQPEVRSWTVHLAARRPGRTMAVIVIILLGLSAVSTLALPCWGVGGWMLLVLLAAVLLIGSVAEFLFPVSYTLDANGAHARFPGSYRHLAWQRVRRIYLRSDGIKLTPLAVFDWTEAYRGVLLRTTEPEAVLGDIRAWLADAGVSPEVIEES